ncbi:MAG: hypothetical protein WBP81_05205 [Solirubrobacteraceae bacterium]
MNTGAPRLLLSHQSDHVTPSAPAPPLGTGHGSALPQPLQLSMSAAHVFAVRGLTLLGTQLSIKGIIGLT